MKPLHVIGWNPQSCTFMGYCFLFSILKIEILYLYIKFLISQFIACSRLLVSKDDRKSGRATSGIEMLAAVM